MFTKTDNCATHDFTRQILTVKQLTLSGSLALVLLLLVGLIISPLASTARAVPTKDTDISGDWNTAANWDPDGVPVSGTDSVNIDLSMTVSAPTSFGDSGGTNNSTWSANSNITINPGQTLTHVGGSTFSVTPASPYFSNTGTFINQGTVLNSTRFLLGYPAAGTSMQNTGTFEFNANNAVLELYSNGTSFSNMPGGKLRVNLGALAEKARVMGSVSANGQYLHAGGLPAEFVQGTLVFAPPGGIGGTLDDAAFANLFGAINANSQLRIGGGIDDISLTAGTTDLSRVRLGDNSTPLRAQSGGTMIDVQVPGGLKFAESVSYLNLPAGRTMTNASTSLLVAPDGGQVFLGDSGTFENLGTINVENNRFLLGYPAAGSTFDNKNLFEFQKNGGHLELYGTNSTFRNLTGGTVKVNLPNASDIARIHAQIVDNNGQFQNVSGNPIVFTKGTLVFAPEGSVLDDTEFGNLFGAINADSELRLGGMFDSISLATADLSRVRLGHTTQTETLRAKPTGTTLNITVPGGLKFANGTPFIDTLTGRTITNSSDSHLVAPSGQSVYFSGTGSFDNEGTVTIENNRFLFGYTVAGTQFNNKGLVKFVENGSRVELYNTGVTMTNTVDGTLQVDLPSDGSLARIYRGLVSAVTFENPGTVEVNRGIFRVEAPITTTSWTSSTLDNGTWNILAGANGATLDLLSNGTSPGSIDTIGANAKVVMGGASPQFIQLSNTTLLVDGTFGVQDQQIYNLTTGLNMGTGGILEFGLEGIDEGGTLTTGIDVDGNVTFDGSQIDILNLGGLGAGTYRIMEFVSASDFATLGDTPGGFSFSLIQGADFLELSVVELPEPSSFLLIGLGAMGLVRHTRRRRLRA